MSTKNDKENLVEDVEGDEKKETKGKPNTFALVLMIIFLLGIAIFGVYYTYYQYNRMEEANSKKVTPETK